MSNTDVVRAMFANFQAQDVEAAKRMLAADFVFTSPQDDHIDKAAYLERCFPTADHFVCQDLLDVVDAGGGVFVRYEYELADGKRYRNAEHITVRDGKVLEVEVYFGGEFPG
ncbi:MAG: nuclear transport factor 2 family protein [Stackebrandtia sp.]